MNPASHRISGAVVATPDVCLTPVGAVIVPIPYTNTALNATAVKFVETVIINGGNALNLGSVLGLSFGDEPGVAHWTIMGIATFVSGFPKVLLEGMPAACLTSTTTSNITNAAGIQSVPSATNVVYGHRARDDAEEVRAELARGAAAIGWSISADRVGTITIPVFSGCAPARVAAAILALVEREAEALVLDLRGNPGGEIAAAIAIAGDFLEHGQEIATVVDADGDAVVHVARPASRCALPLAILVDEDTASAAELLAGALQAHGRALVVGARTRGKGTAQIFTPFAGERVTVARVLLPGGVALDGAGVTPDVPVDGASIMPSPNA